MANLDNYSSSLLYNYMKPAYFFLLSLSYVEIKSTHTVQRE
jgi:hypothetical protein